MENSYGVTNRKKASVYNILARFFLVNIVEYCILKVEIFKQWGKYNMKIQKLICFVILASLFLIVSGCNNEVKITQDTKISELLQNETKDIKLNETKVIPLENNYDNILVLKPYSNKESMQSLTLNSKLVDTIIKSMSVDENYQIFIIKDNKIINFAVLGSSFSTLDDINLKINYPNKLQVVKKEDSRPLKLK